MDSKERKDFMVGSLKFCESFWEREILADHPNKETLLYWIKGVRLESFFKEFTKETFKGKKIAARRPPLHSFKIMSLRNLHLGLVTQWRNTSA